MASTLRIVHYCLIAAMLSQPAIAATVSIDWKTSYAEGERRLRAFDLPGAEAYFRQAVKAVRTQKGHTPDDVARCMQSLGAVLQEQSNTEEAIPFYKHALAIELKSYGKRNSAALPVLIALGKIYENEADYKKALDYYNRALKTEPANAECQYLIGRTSFKSGDVAFAEKTFDAVLTQLMSQPELSSTALLEDVLNDYLNLYHHSAQPARNISSRFQSALLQDQLGKLQMTQAIPPSHFSKEVSARLAKDAAPDRVVGPAADKLRPIAPDKPMHDFAALEQINQQRVAFYERMIATDIDSLGAKHPSVARDLSGLAAVYIAQKKYDQAKPLLERALEIYRTVYGDDALLSKRTVSLLNLIGEEQHEAANAASEPPVNVFNHMPPVPLQSGKLEIALAMNYLALLAFSEGRMEDASKFYGWALADTVLATGENSPLVAACLSDYGKFLRSRGQTAAADSMDRDARRIIRSIRTKEAVLAIP